MDCLWHEPHQCTSLLVVAVESYHAQLCLSGNHDLWMQGWKNGNSLEPWPQPWKLQLAMLSSVRTSWRPSWSFANRRGLQLWCRGRRHEKARKWSSYNVTTYPSLKVVAVGRLFWLLIHSKVTKSAVRGQKRVWQETCLLIYTYYFCFSPCHSTIIYNPTSRDRRMTHSNWLLRKLRQVLWTQAGTWCWRHIQWISSISWRWIGKKKSKCFTSIESIKLSMR